jgi:hypothetical protein
MQIKKTSIMENGQTKRWVKRVMMRIAGELFKDHVKRKFIEKTLTGVKPHKEA